MTTLTMARKDQISDVWIPLTKREADTEPDFSSAIIWTGEPVPHVLANSNLHDSELVQWIVQLFLEAEKHGLNKDMPSDFRFKSKFDGRYFRVKRLRTESGFKLFLRAIPERPPHVDQLKIPPAWRALQLDSSLLYGGLLVFSGTQGQGKTTSASAVVRSRLEKFGGNCHTVERPPEHILEGVHGKGVCFQIPVVASAKNPRAYAAALKDTLRGFPSISGGGTMLFVGEIEDPESAAETLLSASNGHLVICTVHGASITAALNRLIQLAAAYDQMGEKMARDKLAEVLRACFHQTIRRDFEREHASIWDAVSVTGNVLYSQEGGKVADHLREAREEKVIQELSDKQTTICSNSDLTNIKDVKEALKNADHT